MLCSFQACRQVSAAIFARGGSYWWVGMPEFSTMSHRRVKHLQRMLAAGYKNLNRDPSAFATNPHSKHMVQTLRDELGELEALDEGPALLKKIRGQVEKLASALSDSEVQRGILALAAQAVGSEFDEESSDEEDEGVSSAAQHDRGGGGASSVARPYNSKDDVRAELYGTKQARRAQEAPPVHLPLEDDGEMEELSSLTERIKLSSLALQKEIHQGAAVADAADSKIDDLVQGVHKANAVTTKLAAAGSWFATLKSLGLVILIVLVSIFCAAIIRFLPAS